jgi:hypothetical protein
MIDWPKAENDEGKALKLFKKTSLAAELEDDAEKWTFLAYARSAAPPARMVLRSAGGTTRTYALEPTGFWCES